MRHYLSSEGSLIDNAVVYVIILRIESEHELQDRE